MNAKQKNMADTHVDRRETFMSLSKSINDSDSSMEQKLHTLYLIQEKDSRIDEIHLLLGELPDEITDLEDGIEGLKTRVARIKEQMAEAVKSLSQRKIDAENSKMAIEKYKEQQEHVKNNREFVSISREIEYQQLELELANKKIGEKNLQIEELKGQIKETEEIISRRVLDLEAKKKESEAITEENSKEEGALMEEIAELKSSLDPRTLAAYEKVRSNTHNGLAVVTVQRDACGGCFNKIPPQRKLDIAMNKKIIVCEYCGRILVSPDFNNE